MSERSLSLVFRGVRGSTPTPGPHTVRYGGHTTCLELAFTPTHRLIIDCGSGLSSTQSDLPAVPRDGGFRFDVFLTHYHQDHVEGLRFFRPLYDPGSRFRFHAYPPEAMSVERALAGSMTPPWFPIPWEETRSAKSYVHLTDDPVTIEDVTVRSAGVHHPQGARAYRLDRGARSLVFVTDNEPGDAARERAVISLARDADVLIHDAQYLPEEYERQYRNWGHSSWRYAVEMAKQSGARRLVLFHHDPGRSDDEIDRIVELVQREFPGAEAAREGMTLDL